jgi:hypothetical protein
MPARDPGAVPMSEIASVFETLSLLTPYEVKGKKKIRLGARNDGGYICLDFMDRP